MLQAIPRACHGVLYGQHSIYAPVADGKGDVGSSDTFRASWMRSPMPIGGLFKHLVIYSTEAAGDIALTFYKNGLPTTLSVTLAAGTTMAVDVLHSVTVDVGDDVLLVFGGSPVGAPGIHVGYCVEFVGDANYYAMTSTTGSMTAGHGAFGGALGNGEAESITSLADIAGIKSRTYSIAAVGGSVTSICLKELGSIATGGSWTAYIRLNEVVQDGAGGTVNTTTTLADGAGSALGTFNVPIVPGDRVEIVYIRETTNAPFALSQIGVGIGFTPTTDGQFMLCGGSNNAILNNTTGYEWPQAGQQVTPETSAEAPAAYTGITVTGIYVERETAAGLGTSYVYTLRKDEEDTSVTVTTANLATTASITGQYVSYVYGDRMVLEIVPVNGPVSGELHWGMLAMRTGLVEGVIGPYLVWRMAYTVP